MDGIGVQIISRPFEKEVTIANPRGHLVNQPLIQIDVRAIVRHELALALQGSGVRPRELLRSAIGRTEAMQTALSVMLQDGSDLAIQ